MLPKEQDPREEFSPLSVVNEASPPGTDTLPGFCIQKHRKHWQQHHISPSLILPIMSSVKNADSIAMQVINK